ncbi:MAG TPA: energy transducer TonB [Edaphobacter sp.]|nr:energy transducer TonB [Edaphobacter sp.]
MLLFLGAAFASRTLAQQPAVPPPAAESLGQSIPAANPDANGIYHFGRGVVPPRLSHRVRPEFPKEARKRGINGFVVVRLIVDADGHVRDARVAKSAAENYTGKGPRKAALAFDQKALEAVNQYQFVPATFHGRSVPVEFNVDVTFRYGY